jgi:hypothetical protein
MEDKVNGAKKISRVLNTIAMFAWLISHQSTVLFSHNKSAISNQPAVLFSQSKSTTSQQYFSLRTNQPPATSHNQPQYSSLRTN